MAAMQQVSCDLRPLKLQRHTAQAFVHQTRCSVLQQRQQTSDRPCVQTGAYSREAQSMPPPPSPPPPPAPESRRNVLLYAGGAVAGIAGIAALLNGGGDSAFPEVDAREKASIDSLRDEAGFRRSYDGHVVVLSRDGDPVELRLDAKIPGTVLLRDKNGGVFYISIDNVQQIDLTDDYVVVALFGDGAWEDKMQRLTARDDSGNLVDVVLDSDAFRDLISVME